MNDIILPDITVVSGLVNIGRGDLSPLNAEDSHHPFYRSWEGYKEKFGKLLDAIPVPMVLYISEDLEEFVWQHRKQENTKIIIQSKESIRNFEFWDQIQKIRTSPDWYLQKESGATWVQHSAQAVLEYYNPLIMNKYFMVHDSSIFNHFSTNNFVWIDAGIANTVVPSKFNVDFFKKLINMIEDSVLFICFPYENSDGVPVAEIHGMPYKEMVKYAGGNDVNKIARGGFFAGSKEAISLGNPIYYSYLSKTLYQGNMGTEENILTLMMYNNRDICKHITLLKEDSGILSNWVDRVSASKLIDSGSKLGLYMLSFNAPDQYKILVESFLDQSYKNVFIKSQKYLINNSTDNSTNTQYDDICNNHNIQQIRKPNNIGISGGRLLASKMFDSSGEDYMIFYEDDMLMAKEKTKNCRNGFIRYHTDLFIKCRQIMEIENLDFLKLSFTEVFGDNHDNWTWVNLSDEDRLKFFPGKQIHGSCNATKITKTDSVSGLSYAIGNFHYCNWPIMISKEGNKKMFLHNDANFNTEREFMINIGKKQAIGEIKAGCLLASVIDHNRQHGYMIDIRKEC